MRSRPYRGRPPRARSGGCGHRERKGCESRAAEPAPAATRPAPRDGAPAAQTAALHPAAPTHAHRQTSNALLGGCRAREMCSPFLGLVRRTPRTRACRQTCHRTVGTPRRTGLPPGCSRSHIVRYRRAYLEWPVHTRRCCPVLPPSTPPPFSSSQRSARRCSDAGVRAADQRRSTAELSCRREQHRPRSADERVLPVWMLGLSRCQLVCCDLARTRALCAHAQRMDLPPAAAVDFGSARPVTLEIEQPSC